MLYLSNIRLKISNKKLFLTNSNAMKELDLVGTGRDNRYSANVFVSLTGTAIGVGTIIYILSSYWYERKKV